jgi:hypothetical protein
MMVYAAHVADDLAIEICLQNRLNLAKGQHDLQAGRQGFLVGRPSHAATKQYLAIVDGSKHISMTMVMIVVLVLAISMLTMIGLGTLLLCKNRAVLDIEDMIVRSTPKVAAQFVVIFGYCSNFYHPDLINSDSTGDRAWAGQNRQ